MVDLVSYTTAKIMEDKITADNVVDLSSFAKVFSGADETAATPSKAGDIFVKTGGTIYMAKGTNPASDWVAVYTPEA